MGPHSIDKTWDLFSQAMKPAVVPSEQKPTAPQPAQVEEQVAETSKEKKSKKKKDKKSKEAEEEDTPAVVVADKNEEESPKKKKKRSKEKDKENVEAEMEVDNEVSIGKKKKKKKKKGLKDQENVEEVVDSDGASTKKSKKRKKRCIAEYMSQHEGTHKTKEDLAVKFNKKLKKRKYKVLKDRVTLKTDTEEDAEETMEVYQKKTVATCLEKPVVAPPVQKAQSDLSFNKWEATNFGSSAQNEKFRRLMGIKSAPPPEAVKVDNKRDDKKMFAELEEGFEKARQMRQAGQGMGLGFAATCQTGSYV